MRAKVNVRDRGFVVRSKGLPLGNDLWGIKCWHNR